jgi:SAM-dependent methyltransferase
MFAPDIVHMWDAVWCDVHGAYVEGWAHAWDRRIVSMYLASGSSRVDIVELTNRPDLLAFYPTLPSTRCGFSGYLACRPFRPLHLGVVTASGTTEIEVTALPQDHPLNRFPSEALTPSRLFDDFTAEMKDRRGSVIEVGARKVSPNAIANRARFTPACRFIGVDIHADPLVDVVADAHFLGEYFGAGSIDGLFSLAVMEHLAAPWLFAAEINKILRPGGLTFHVLPQSWPIHELPNDFWRMSEEALKVLFSAELGFEVLATRSSMPIQMFPHPVFRQDPFLKFPLHPGMGLIEVLARKVRSIAADEVRWPRDRTAFHVLGKSYPQHASSSGGG